MTVPAFALGVDSTSASCRGLIPDVSNWQGTSVDWKSAAACGIAGGIFKGGEGTGVDWTAATNNSALRSLHLWHAMYWYIRAVGCQAEADAISREAHTLGVVVVVNDLESPSDNAGYGACLPPLEKKAGLVPVDYTSPGTWSGGDGGFGAVPEWQAEYGPVLHPLWTPVVAWQCTDGHYGCVTYIPGIGYGDVSKDQGITKLGAAPKPKAPHCFGSRPYDKGATCTRLRHEVDAWWKELHVSVHNLRSEGCVLLWVRKSDDSVQVSLKTGPICTRIKQRASAERHSIDTVTKHYR